MLVQYAFYVPNTVSQKTRLLQLLIIFVGIYLIEFSILHVKNF